MTMHYRPSQLSVLFVALLVAVTVESFSHLASTTTRRQHIQQQQQQRSSLAFVASSSSPPPLTTRLFAEGEATAEEETATTEEEEEPETTEAKGDEDEDADAKEEEEEEAVDEVTALKEEIAGFEKELQSKRASLQSLEDSLDLYSKAGYTRRIAQIENLKRSQLSRAASSKDAAVGPVVAEFLPVLERLEEQKDQYAESQFGTNYAGLTGALKSSLTSLGLQEFTVAPGEAVDDVLRIKVVDQQYSDEYAVDTVLECQSSGFEMGGTVLRPADCVASLGSESAKEEEAEEAEEEEEEEASEDE